MFNKLRKFKTLQKRKLKKQERGTNIIRSLKAKTGRISHFSYFQLSVAQEYTILGK